MVLVSGPYVGLAVSRVPDHYLHLLLLQVRHCLNGNEFDDAVEEECATRWGKGWVCPTTEERDRAVALEVLAVGPQVIMQEQWFGDFTRVYLEEGIAWARGRLLLTARQREWERQLERERQREWERRRSDSE